MHISRMVGTLLSMSDKPTMTAWNFEETQSFDPQLETIKQQQATRSAYTAAGNIMAKEKREDSETKEEIKQINNMQASYPIYMSPDEQAVHMAIDSVQVVTNKPARKPKHFIKVICIVFVTVVIIIMLSVVTR